MQRRRRFAPPGCGIIAALSSDPLLAPRVNICHSLRAEVHRFPSFGKQTYYYHVFVSPCGKVKVLQLHGHVKQARRVHRRTRPLRNREKWLRRVTFAYGATIFRSTGLFVRFKTLNSTFGADICFVFFTPIFVSSSLFFRKKKEVEKKMCQIMRWNL